MRRLLDGERFGHDGRVYTFHDALCAPRPVQAHLPILIGGSGPAQDAADRRRAGRRLEHLRDARGSRGRAGRPGAARASGRAGPRDPREDDQLPDRHRATRRAGREARMDAAPGAQRRAATWARAAPGSARRMRSPTRSGRTATWASRRSSCACPRPTTARPSSGSARSRERLDAMKVVELAGGVGGAKLAEGLAAHLGGGPDRRRQHRRRPGAARPGRLARPRHGRLHAGRPRRRGARLGPRATRPGPSWSGSRPCGDDPWFRLGDRDLADPPVAHRPAARRRPTDGRRARAARPPSASPRRSCR